MVKALPRRKDEYLFEGRIWIDSIAFAIVKIAGHPARNPSLWITRADFVREYEKIGDFWFPVKDEISVDVKLYGRKTLTIEHRINRINHAKIVATELGGCLLSSSLPRQSRACTLDPLPECQAFDTTSLSPAMTDTLGRSCRLDLAL